MRYISCLILIAFCACSPRFRLSDFSVYSHTIQHQEEDPHVEAFLTPFRKELKQEMNDIIGASDIMLTKDKPEGTLGNWVAQTLYDYAKSNSKVKVDIAFQNSGGLRLPSLPAGPISRGMIYELMPFDNLLVLLQVPGDTMQLFLDHFAKHGGGPVSDNFYMKIEDNKAIDVQINGQKFDKNREYIIALPDYIANGGGNCSFFQTLKQHPTHKLIREILIESIKAKHKEGETISSRLTQRIVK